MSPKYQSLLLLTALPWIVVAAHAAPAHDHEAHHQEAHQHGVAQLNLVRDGDEVHLELDGPAANLFGFEHAPHSEQEHAAVKRARALLENGDRLFRFPAAADCRQAALSLTSPLLEVAGHEEHGHDEHDHGEPGREDHDEAAHSDEAGGHADLRAEYRFHCARAERIDRLEVGLFEVFPAIEHIEVQFVLGDRQGGADLAADKPVLTF